MGSITIDTDQLRSAVEAGRTLTSVAAELGVSWPTLSRAAKAAGILWLRTAHIEPDLR